MLESNLKPNLQKLVNRNYAAMSFRDYYAVDVLDQVQEYLRENTGEEPQDYRVVSLGIDPAAALYHGFYCLDGYSNNYSLSTSTVSGRSLHRSWTRVNIWKTALTIGESLLFVQRGMPRLL